MNNNKNDNRSEIMSSTIRTLPAIAQTCMLPSYQSKKTRIFQLMRCYGGGESTCFQVHCFLLINNNIAHRGNHDCSWTKTSGKVPPGQSPTRTGCPWTILGRFSFRASIPNFSPCSSLKSERKVWNMKMRHSLFLSCVQSLVYMGLQNVLPPWWKCVAAM